MFKTGELRAIAGTPEGERLCIFLEGVIASRLLCNDVINLASSVGQHDLAIELLDYIKGEDHGGRASK